MAKRAREFTEKKHEKWLSEGRGLGFGKEYKPWLTIQDVPSNGRVSRIRGIKVNRQHEVFSDLEKKYLYILEFSEKVIDIREQYPLLPRADTISIAEEIDVKHPTDPKSQVPIVMTTDFLITDKNNKTYARTIKPSDALNERQIEKFEIERRYWKMKNIDWGIVTEKEIDNIIAKNIEIVRPFYFIEKIDLFSSQRKKALDKLIREFKQILICSKESVRDEALKFEEKYILKDGFSIGIFKYLIISKQIKIDIKKNLTVDSYQKITEVYESYSQEGVLNEHSL